MDISMPQVRCRRITNPLVNINRYVLSPNREINLVNLRIPKRVNVSPNVPRSCYLTKATRNGMKRTIILNGGLRPLRRIYTNRYISLGMVQLPSNGNLRLAMLNLSFLSSFLRGRGIATNFNNLPMNTTKPRFPFKNTRTKGIKEINRKPTRASINILTRTRKVTVRRPRTISDDKRVNRRPR